MSTIAIVLLIMLSVYLSVWVYKLTHTPSVDTTPVEEVANPLPTTMQQLHRMLQEAYALGFKHGHDAAKRGLDYRINKAHIVWVGIQKDTFYRGYRCTWKDVRVIDNDLAAAPIERVPQSNGNGYYVTDPDTGDRVYIS